MKTRVRLAVLAVTALLFSSCSIMCHKKTSLKDTTWFAENKVFIADVGNASVTYTLELLNDKNFRLTELFVTPSHPAMYMNADGTVDTIPGHSSVFVKEGTYTFKGRKLVLTPEDGIPMEYTLDGDVFVGDGPLGKKQIFRRSN